MNKHVVIVAGGTGGHIYPALAFAQTWVARGHRVAWIGTPQGLEASLVPAHHFPLYFISARGWRRTQKIHKIFALGAALRAFFQALRHLRRLRPNLMLAMGGYVSGPSALAAVYLGIPVVVHEQNALAGKTNQYIARYAKKVLTAFPGVLSVYHALLCGNPVRQDLWSVPVKSRAQTTMNVLVLGGSRGALSLNTRLPPLLQQLPHLAIWHQTGAQHVAVTSAAYTQGNNRDIRITPYIDDMCAAYTWADIVICRAGAMTVFEVMAIGRPAIFIPYPYAVDDHQTANAHSLVVRNAAMVIQESELTLETLQYYLDALREPLNYQRYAYNAHRGRIVDADQRMVNACLEVAQ